jgi:hypothetical protein
MNHHQQCSNSIVRTSGTFVRVLLRWPGQVVYTPGLQFSVLQFPLLFGHSVKFTILISTLSSGDFITLSGGGLPMLMLRTSAKRPQFRSGMFARFLTLC